MKPDCNKKESDLIKKKNLAISDREFCRICPSKLTKHELEDLYFSLLESNFQLKKSINEQAERIKNLLNIKHGRDSAQKVLQADETKDCCINRKCLMHQQKQSIISLKRENERLAERIRMLNMKLSSIKQFSNIPVSSFRRLSTQSAAINKLSAIRENNMRSVDIQTVPPVDSSSEEVQTEPEQQSALISNMAQTEWLTELRVCDENKCRNEMCELQKMVVMLREELDNTHKEYTTRINRLEEQVLNNSSQRIGNDSQEDVSGHEKELNHLMNNLKAAGELSNELKMQLSIEKLKVTDLVKKIKDIENSNQITPNKDEATNTVGIESFEAELTTSGGGKCSCPRLSPRRISKLIHLYRQGLSLENERCSNCCEELELCKKNCGEAIKSSSFTVTNDDIIDINQNRLNENKAKYLRSDKNHQNKFNEPINSNAHNNKKSVNTANVKIQIQTDPNLHMKPNSYWNQCKIQDVSDSKTQQSQFDNLNKNEEKVNKTQIPDYYKLQPLADGYQDKTMDQEDKCYKAIKNDNISNNLGVLEDKEANKNCITNKPKKLWGRGPSNVVDSKQLSTNKDEMETRFSNKSTCNKKEDFFRTNEYEVSPVSKSSASSPELSIHGICKKNNIRRNDKTTASPDSFCNDVLSIVPEANSKIIFALTDDLENASRKLNKLNTLKNISKANDSTEAQNIHFDATINETLDTQLGNSSTIAQNERVAPKYQDRSISPIDITSGDETCINQPVKIPPPNYAERNVPHISLSTDETIGKTRTQELEGMRPPKGDQHNSLQIPGPIPISESAANNSYKTNVHKRFKKEINERRNKTQNSKYKEIPSRFILPKAVEKAIQVIEIDIKATESRLCQLDHIEGENNSLCNISVTADKDKCNKLTQNQIAAASNSLAKNTLKNAPEIGSKCAKTMAVRKNSTVPLQIQRAVATYRRKSGTLCFKTVPSNNVRRSHICKCDKLKPCGGLINKGVQSDERSQKTLIQEQGVCFTECPECSREASLVSTVLERSFMVDSREEHVKPSKSNKHTLNEHKYSTREEKEYATAMTNTSNNDAISPLFEAVKKASYGKSETQENYSQSMLGLSQYNIQEKLDSITEELENCKRMIQTQYSNPEHSEEKRISESLNWDQARSQLTLTEDVATHNLSDVPAPRCVFTLHIGTIVLSDEAVLNSKDKSLILTWKFFDQKVSMSRMRTGRVVLYDFSTEYEILLTDDFLNYMKHEEMPIIICELDKQEEPYARCALPLRDALLHINTRAVMSLALVAGPQMIHARSKNSEASDPLDASDEMGVMDVWCMLQADNKLLPAINRVISRPSPLQPLSHTKDDSCVMLQVTPQNEIFRSQEDLLHRPNLTTDKTTSTDDKPKEEKLYRWGSSVLRLPSKEVSDDISGKSAFSNTVPQVNKEQVCYKQEENSFDEHMSMSKRQNSNVLRLPNTVAIDRGAEYPRRESSRFSGCYRDSESKHTKKPKSYLHERGDPETRIIINEVIPNIRTSADMKEAMIARNRNSIHNISRIPKEEEDIISQARSSNTSSYYKNVFGKLQRKSLSKMTSKDRASFIKNKRTAEQELEPMLPVESDDEYDNISKKYDNISKLCGYKTDQSKKSVTINSNSRHGSAEGIEEEPQRDKPSITNANDFQTIDITILWLALNEECEAMSDPRIQRVYVAYSFLGRSGADLETPVSLPKPKHYVDKVYFNFKKSFHLEDEDIPRLGHMARCRSVSMISIEPKDCIVFSVVSEPPDDTLSLESCEDIGHAYIYLGDLLAYSVGSNCYTEVTPVRAKNGCSVCGVLAVRIDGLNVLRRCIQMTAQESNITML